MKKISVKTDSQTSDILVGEKWTNVSKYLPGKNVVVITDDNILEFYGSEFRDFPVVSVKPGEGSKTLKVVENVASQILATGTDRSGFLLGIGGGVVSDLTGFTASVYMRGIRFGFVSSSLLSQVDASVGGKNGVNLGSVKNILGTFRQPDFVICDPGMLVTLTADEYLSGLAELIKMSIILDSDMFRVIGNNREKILKRDRELMEYLISRSIELKAAVVSQDEKETGKRMILNFGHTFGHAIETNLKRKHGFAVASGMVLSAAISLREGLLEQDEFDRLKSLLSDFGLLKKHSVPSVKLSALLLSDKKKSGSDISFVMVRSIGEAVVRKISVDKLSDYYKSLNSTE